MRLEYRLTFGDYLLFCATHQLLSVPLQGASLLMASAIYALTDDVAGSLNATILALLTYLAVWASQLVFNIVYLYSSKNKSLLTDHVVEVQNDAFYDETRFNRSFHYWPGVARVVRRPGFVAVYTNATAAHIIPRRAFSSRAHVDEFVAMARRRLATATASVSAR